MSLTHKLERVMIARGWDGGVGTLLMGVVFLFGKEVLELGNGDGWIVVNNPEKKLLELYILRW